MYEEEKDKEAIFDYLRQNSSRETDPVTIRQALTDKRYRRITFIMFFFALCTFFTGLFMV